MFAKLMGVEEMVKDKGELGTRMLLEQAGVSTQDWIPLISMVKDLEKGGVFQAQDPFKAFREFTSDPRNAATSEDLKNLRRHAKDLGKEGKSALDKASASLVDISNYFNKEYWSKGRDAIREAFGLKKTAETTAELTEKQRGALAEGEGTPAAAGVVDAVMRQLAVMFGDPLAGYTEEGLYSGWVARTETTRIDGQTQTAMAHEAARNVSGLKPTGAQ
jgi:hypothetical protein